MYLRVVRLHHPILVALMWNTDHSPIPRDAVACGRLIRHAFSLHELASLIDSILLDEDERETISSLPIDDAQTLVNVIDDVRSIFGYSRRFIELTLSCPVEQTLNTPDLLPLTQKKCLKLLYRTCGHHALLPETLKVSARYGHTGNLPCRGGHADVWKGEYRGQDVAVKVLRTYSNRELEKMINVGRLIHPI